MSLIEDRCTLTDRAVADVYRKRIEGFKPGIHHGVRIDRWAVPGVRDERVQELTVAGVD